MSKDSPALARKRVKNASASTVSEGGGSTSVDRYIRRPVSNESGKAAQRKFLKFAIAADEKSLIRVAKENNLSVFNLATGLLAILINRLSGQPSVKIGCRTTDLVNLEGSVRALESGHAGISFDGKVDQTVFEFSKALKIEPVSSQNQNVGSPLFEIGSISLKASAKTKRSTQSDELMKSCDWAHLCFSIDLNNPREILISYRTESFTEGQVQAMGQQLAFLLSQVVGTSNLQVKDLSLVCKEHADILPDPTATLGAPTYKLLKEMLAESVKRFPKAVALSGDKQLTYAELDKVSDDILKVLREAGAGPGRVIAVSGQKSIGIIASIIAVIKSGSVLLNVDPKLPQKRQATMMKVAQAGCLISVSETEETMDGLSSIIQIRPSDAKVLNSKRLEFKWPQLDRGGGDAAYIFCTSGTTGEPKAILGSHKGLAHFLTWQSSTFPVGPGDRHAQLIGLSFDVVMRDIFFPLVNGATLCLPDTDLGGDRILEWMEKESISVFHAVPSLVESWLPFASPELKLEKLRRVFFAGEPLTDSLLRRWRNLFGDSCSIANFYGPTETTLAKLSYMVPKDPLNGIQPVGRPQPHCQALVLNSQNKLCGIGEPGEIVIRTSFMSHGYLNANSDQNEKFIGNPFKKDASDRCYRTGDMGQYLTDGNILLLGRKDHQIKISGQRVELGEIESAIVRQPEVNQSIVLAPQVAGHYQLVAFIILSEGKSLSEDELVARLGQDLPGYMIPSTTVFLKAFPLTANGKVDRPALLEIWKGAAAARIDSMKPIESKMQKKLLELWSEALRRPNLDHVRAETDFFRSGGTSLFALALVASIRRHFDVDIHVSSIFKNPTLEKMAALVEEKVRTRSTKPRLFAVKPAQTSGAFSYEQEFFWRLEADVKAGRSRTCRIFEFSGRLDSERLESSLKELASANVGLRTSISLVNGNPVQTIADTPAKIMEVIDLSKSSAEQEKAQLRKKTEDVCEKPIDLLGQAAFFRVVLLRLRNGNDVLLIGLPHVLADGIALNVLMRDLAQIYSGQTLPSNKKLNAIDYALSQAEDEKSDEFLKKRRFWDKTLGTKRSKQPMRSMETASKNFSIPLSELSNLKQFCDQNGFTMFNATVGIFGQMVMESTSRKSGVVHVLYSGRSNASDSEFIGNLATFVPLKIDLTQKQSWVDFISKTKNDWLDLCSNLPFSTSDLWDRLDVNEPRVVLNLLPTDDSVKFGKLVAIDRSSEVRKVNVFPLFDLGLYLEITEEAILATIRGKTALFDVEAFAKRFRDLLLKGNRL